MLERLGSAGAFDPTYPEVLPGPSHRFGDVVPAGNPGGQVGPGQRTSTPSRWEGPGRPNPSSTYPGPERVAVVRDSTLHVGALRPGTTPGAKDQTTPGRFGVYRGDPERLGYGSPESPLLGSRPLLSGPVWDLGHDDHPGVPPPPSLSSSLDVVPGVGTTPRSRDGPTRPDSTESSRKHGP